MSELRNRLEEFLLENKQPLAVEPITPDASTREYFRVSWNGDSAIACVYPFNDLCQGQFAACLDVTEVFLSENLPVARIFAEDDDKQIIVQEDFGDMILREALFHSGEAEREKFLDAAIALIARIQAATPRAFAMNSVASRLKFDEEKLFWELNFFKEHYFSSLKKQPLAVADDEHLTAEFFEIARELETKAQVLCHRDFHAANLMLDPNGDLRIIDYQDARIGSIAYDLVSLLLDRVSAAPPIGWVDEKKRFFLNERERLGLEKVDARAFGYEFDLQTIQRCLKAAGTFSFQSVNRGKVRFIPFIAPMLTLADQAAERLNRFPALRKIIAENLR